MKICAIIAEFNPFHLGHKSLIEQAKKETKCDFVFCFMGQNFTSRAEPAILDKKVRAQMAVDGGCDAVFEIPNALTIVNAEMFANFTLKAVMSFQNITHLAFGSECGEIEPILELAKYLNTEPTEYSLAIKTFLKDGNSLNVAKQKALEFVIDNKLQKFKDPKTTKTLLSLPNNILAVEYAKVLLRENSPIIPVTFKREKDYSATEIREICYIGNIKPIKEKIGSSAYRIFVQAETTQKLPNLKMFNYTKLVNAGLCLFDMKRIQDVSEGLDRKIVKEAQQNINYTGFSNAIMSRRYGKNRIERIMLSNILGIDKAIIQKTLKRKNLPYLKAICLKGNRKNLLPELKQSRSRIILRKSDAEIALQKSKLARELNEIDNKCEYLYALLTKKPANKNNLFVKTTFVKKI